ncbi:MAG: hypothetical protein EOP07_17065 [Proteobacteria bacterium]|nr:MAG: hypothetical protein EOP07_17065 [Pseudomonadota bacterium]
MKISSPVLALTVGLLLSNFTEASFAAPRPKTKKKAVVEKTDEPVVEESTAAEIEDTEAEASATSSTKKKKSKKADPNSSLSKRQNLKLELLLDAIGFTPSPTFGVSVGYFFTPNQIISGRYGSASGVISSMDEKILSIDLKSFWGNSFYTRAGFSKRDYDFSWDVYPSDGDGNISFETETLTAKTSSMGLELGLGNQWQWSSFTIGADWVGVYLPLSSSGTDEVVNKDGAVEAGLFSNVDDDVKYAKTTQMAFVRFYLGFAF